MFKTKLLTEVEKYNLLKCPCLAISSYSQAYEYVSELIKSKRGGYTAAINALKILQYRKDKQTKEIIDNAILQTPDGFGALISFKWLHKIKVIKLDLPGLVLDISNNTSLRVFLLGASEENNLAAVNGIANLYPNIIVAGRQNGFFNNLNMVVHAIQNAKPDLVLIAMGSPKQEILSAELLKNFPETLFIGCGGRLDILAGKLKRAPNWYIKNNLEWFYRLWKQPKRIKQQIFLFKFLIILIVKKMF
ncbi:MAG: hypothetical protein A2W91_07265 [Bacteroidetes bacterium GWF2_38_335]|nr:MAG: hypothetical protein A2W91_07265 [Bacteroidetes bacterium GWF2_38_335]OFY77127.1 MAG: hypothetical protein A2281_14500 [Bacteroidetes bacterium RIFOXYA12_FULL_38_20]HBS85018.1 hypothetical protein [Bacteroidales bacterium]